MIVTGSTASTAKGLRSLAVGGNRPNSVGDTLLSNVNLESSSDVDEDSDTERYKQRIAINFWIDNVFQTGYPRSYVRRSRVTAQDGCYHH